MKHTLAGKSVAAWVLAFSVFYASPVQAEGTNPAVDNDRCGVDPGVEGNPKSFGDKLDACNGVLKPPRVGDSELVEPTPDVGKTPVIRPGELPEQHGSKP
jgi:hypothetical protein